MFGSNRLNKVLIDEVVKMTFLLQATVSHKHADSSVTYDWLLMAAMRTLAVHRSHLLHILFHAHLTFHTCMYYGHPELIRMLT